MYTTLAIIAGFILDALLGDPYSFPHPVRLMGKGIAGMENILYDRKFFRISYHTKKLSHRGVKELCCKSNPSQEKSLKKQNALFYNKAQTDKDKLFAGGIMVFVILAATALLSGAVLYIGYHIHLMVGFVIESVMCYQILAARCLQKESMLVHDVVVAGDIKKARKQVAMIVGRDTEKLDEEGVIRAAVETVAENTSDGVVAPLIYMAVGGPVAGFLYKAVNTMDSMVGYKNERYLHYGRAAAKLDDALNYIPARIAAFAMIGASFLIKGCDGKEAYRIHKRDARNHASPNSAQTESVCAGALGIRLAGDASYFGKIVKKPTIGDDKRAVTASDIRMANILMYVSAVLVLAAAVGIRWFVFWAV